MSSRSRLIPLEDLEREWFSDPEMRAAFEREFPFAEVARAVVALRARCGLSQSEFAAKVGCPQSYIARLESGKSNARMDTLLSFAKAVGVRLRIEYDDAAARELVVAGR
jgi:predicted transcriptional regulator